MNDMEKQVKYYDSQHCLEELKIPQNICQHNPFHKPVTDPRISRNQTDSAMRFFLTFGRSSINSFFSNCEWIEVVKVRIDLLISS
jgi:hypothetical protein